MSASTKPQYRAQITRARIGWNVHVEDSVRYKPDFVTTATAWALTKRGATSRAIRIMRRAAKTHQRQHRTRTVVTLPNPTKETPR